MALMVRVMGVMITPPKSKTMEVIPARSSVEPVVFIGSD